MLAVILLLCSAGLYHTNPQFPLPQAEINVDLSTVIVTVTKPTTKRPNFRTTRKYPRFITTTSANLDDIARIFAEAAYREALEFKALESEPITAAEEIPTTQETYDTTSMSSTTATNFSIKTALEQHAAQLNYTTSNNTSWLTVATLLNTGNLAFIVSLVALGKHKIYLNRFCILNLHFNLYCL